MKQLSKYSQLKQFTQHQMIDLLNIHQEIDKINTKIQIVRAMQWEISSYDRFRTIASKVLRFANCFIFIFDKSDRESFDDLECYIREIYESTLNQACKFLVSNKIDLDCQVCGEEAMELAKKYDMIYLEICAKSGIGVELLLQVTSRYLVETFY